MWRLLQVPAAVAKLWQGQTRDAIRNNRRLLLGTLETSSEGGKRSLELANCAAQDNERIPKHYKVEEAAIGNTVTTFLFASRLEGPNEGICTSSRFNLSVCLQCSTC